MQVARQQQHSEAEATAVPRVLGQSARDLLPSWAEDSAASSTTNQGGEDLERELIRAVLKLRPGSRSQRGLFSSRPQTREGDVKRWQGVPGEKLSVAESDRRTAVRISRMVRAARCMPAVHV